MVYQSIFEHFWPGREDVIEAFEAGSFEVEDIPTAFETLNQITVAVLSGNAPDS